MKENLVIACHNDNERIEAQELLFSMGYAWRSIGKNLLDNFKIDYLTDYLTAYFDGMYLLQCDEARESFKRINFDELRELAKPREYLNSEFELVVTNQPDDGWKLVPGGADRYTRAINGHETFWDNDNSILIHGGYGGMSGRYTFGYYVEHYKAKILWQRENKVEKVKGREGNAGRFLHQEWYEAFGRGGDVQFKLTNHSDNQWKTLSTHSTFEKFNENQYEFRLKPQTIQIGSRTIVKPISVKPEIGQTFYVSSIASMGKFLSDKWKNSDSQNEMLVRNLCHLTKEDAINHTDALLELME